ncbi:MAG: DUF885 family protein [Alphaproteobacteria bacterium]|nr:DUF885 family protein [Alphaproteobacteria bacterium]
MKRINRRELMIGTSATLGLAFAMGLSGCSTPIEAADLDAVLDSLATNLLRDSPEFATSLAVSEARAGGPYLDRWSDVSREGFLQTRSILEQGLAALAPFAEKGLTGQDAVSLEVVRTSLQNDVDSMRFAYGSGAGGPYIVNQIEGGYTWVPDFLDSQHPVTSKAQADAYLARLSGYARLMDQESAVVALDAAAGVVAPLFCLDGAIRQLTAFASIAPAETVLVQSLARRAVEAQDIPEAERAAYAERAEAIVRNEIIPAYQRQIAALQAVRGQATEDAGIWKLPDGEAMYAAALKNQTTTSLSPDEVHAMGVELVAELQAEMEAILRAEGLTRGTVAERIQSVSRRPDQLYPNTDEGRAQLLADLNAQVGAITARMPEICGTLAQAALEIRRVPPYVEAGAPGGYYQAAAPDGSRPGAYFINLRNTAEWPKYTLPTLTYHEATPGHHWQISIQQEAQGLPFIRTAMLGFNAYAEGWALYAEQLADELGMYANDRLGRLGYLQSAAFRASRLVVDTGLHVKRWTREEAIQSMLAATGDQRSSIETEIDRYCVWPGQACGYMVGRQEILRLRAEAQAALGDLFDLKGFHDTVLVNGSTPLSVTESLVRAWMAQPG